MRRFEKKLHSWRVDLQRAGAEAVTASARRGARLAREHAPVDSGELRSKIDVQRMGGSAAVVSRAEHAAAVEYGTSRAPAQPYMLPMAREMRREFTDQMRRMLREVFT